MNKHLSLPSSATLGSIRWLFSLVRRLPRSLVVLSALVGLFAAVIPALSVRAIQGLANGLEKDNSILFSLVLVALVFGFSGVLQQLNYAFARRVASRVNSLAAATLNEKLSSIAPSVFLDSNWMKGLTSARQCVIEGKASTAVQGLFNIILAGVTSLTLVASLWAISPGGALVSVFAAVPVLLTYGWYGRQESELWPVLASHSRRAAYFDEQLAHPRSAIELVATGGADYVGQLADDSRREGIFVKDRLEKLSVFSDSLAGLGSSLCLLIALVLFWSSKNGQPVDLAAGVVGIVSGMSAMSGLGYQVGELATSMPAVSKFREFLSSGRENGSGTITRICSYSYHVEALILQGVEARYPSSVTPVIEDVSLAFKVGTITAIVGANGAGKTTLVRVMAGILEPDRGKCSITAENNDILTPGTNTVAFLGQDFGRYELTVREYLTLGAGHTVSDKQIQSTLAKVRMEEKIHSLPQGLDTQLGSSWGGVDLSGGQWQKLAIARLFLLDRPIWILDEPTSAVDAESEAEIFSLLRTEFTDRCIIVVTHRASTLTQMENIVVVANGRVVQRGSFNELRRSPGHFQDMFHVQIAEAERLTGLEIGTQPGS